MTMKESIEHYLDEHHYFGSGTSSIAPADEVAEAIDNGALILDVRTGREVKKGTAPGAQNISVFVLKHHLDELPRDRTIVTCCMTGMRAGKARDILDRNGFTVLNGGPFPALTEMIEKNETTD